MESRVGGLYPSACIAPGRLAVPSHGIGPLAGPGRVRILTQF
jgi:hypothetical protein